MFKKKKKKDLIETASIETQITEEMEEAEATDNPVYTEENPMEDDFSSEEDVVVTKPKKFGNTKRMAGAALMVACIATLLLVEPVQKIVHNGELVTVYVAKTDISKGNIIETHMVEAQDIEKTNGLTSFVYSDNPVGKYAQVDIGKSDMFTKNAVGVESPFEHSYLYDIKEGKQIISVSMGNLASGLSGYAQGNDVVRLYTFSDGEAYTPKELQYVRVLDVTYNSDETTINTIILEVTGEQAEKLVELEYTSGLHMTLMSRANKLEAERMLTVQEAYLESMRNKAPVAEENDAE